MHNSKILKRLIKHDDRGEFFHTSRYAKAQNGSNIGAASAEGFAQRMKVDKNRTRVKRYGESRIGTQANSGAKPKAYDSAVFKAAREERFGGVNKNRGR